jgi:hypothetical protein
VRYWLFKIIDHTYQVEGFRSRTWATVQRCRVEGDGRGVGTGDHTLLPHLRQAASQIEAGVPAYRLSVSHPCRVSGANCVTMVLPQDSNERTHSNKTSTDVPAPRPAGPPGCGMLRPNSMTYRSSATRNPRHHERAEGIESH